MYGIIFTKSTIINWHSVNKFISSVFSKKKQDILRLLKKGGSGKKPKLYPKLSKFAQINYFRN